MPATTWAEKLRECEAPADNASRAGWLRRAYARIYRFLLSQYSTTPPLDAPREPMPFVDQTEALDGKAARSLGEIRHTLKDITANQPEDPAASIRRDKEIWITVAVADKRLHLPACLRWLGMHGVETRVVSEGRRKVVRVRREQADEAFALMERAKDMLVSDLPALRAAERREPRQVKVYREPREIKQLDDRSGTRIYASVLLVGVACGVYFAALLLRHEGVIPFVEPSIIGVAAFATLLFGGALLHAMFRKP
jgi:hypothetical protein